MYPQSSRIATKKNKSAICGKNASTAPAPATTPLTTRDCSIPDGSILVSSWPSQCSAISIAEFSGAVHVKIAWKTKTITTRKMTMPMIG